MTEYVTSQMHTRIRNILTGVLLAMGLQVAVLAEDSKPLTYTFKHKGNDRIYSVFQPLHFVPAAPPLREVAVPTETQRLT